MSDGLPLTNGSDDRRFKLLRSVTRHYPFLRGTRRISRAISPFVGQHARWVVTPDNRFLPRLALDMKTEFQRRLYLFPRAYSHLYMRSELVSLLRRELQPGGVFLDIGSNVGIYSMLAAELVGPNGNVYSFEPDPVSFEALRRSALANRFDHLYPQNVAVSDVNSQSVLYRDAPGSTANSLVGYKADAPSAHREAVPVRVVRMDDYYRSINLDASRIKLIKIDVEGAEVQAVAGALEVLRAALPPVWCEVRGPAGSDRAPNTFIGVASLLTGLSYRSFRVVNGHEVGATEVEGREDILFRHCGA